MISDSSVTHQYQTTLHRHILEFWYSYSCAQLNTVFVPKQNLYLLNYFEKTIQLWLSVFQVFLRFLPDGGRYCKSPSHPDASFLVRYVTGLAHQFVSGANVNGHIGPTITLWRGASHSRGDHQANATSL